MSLLEIKTVTITDKGQIAIPKDIRELKGFQTGDKIAILAYKDYVELRPIQQVSKKMETTVASEKSLAKKWNSKEDEKAWKHL